MDYFTIDCCVEYSIGLIPLVGEVGDITLSISTTEELFVVNDVDNGE